MARSSVPAGSSFAFDSGMRLLDEQERRTNSLDSKAAVVLGGAGIIAGFVLRDDSFIRSAPRAVSVGVSAGLICSMLFALLAFATRQYSVAPRLESAIRMMAADEEWLKWRFLGNIQQAHQDNELRLSLKARLLTFGHGALLATVGALGGYFCYLLITRS